MRNSRFESVKTKLFNEDKSFLMKNSLLSQGEPTVSPYVFLIALNLSKSNGIRIKVWIRVSRGNTRTHTHIHVDNSMRSWSREKRKECLLSSLRCQWCKDIQAAGIYRCMQRGWAALIKMSHKCAQTVNLWAKEETDPENVTINSRKCLMMSWRQRELSEGTVRLKWHWSQVLGLYMMMFFFFRWIHEIKRLWRRRQWRSGESCCLTARKFKALPPTV